MCAPADLRKQGPEKFIVIVPIIAAATCDVFCDEVDEVVCAVTPETFQAVGLWYEGFSQTTDEEAHDLFEQAAERGKRAAP
jgi:putative phosphoribosyl transferase